MTHRQHIIDLALQAQDTPTANALTQYDALLVLISKVAGPGGHLDAAIELVSQRRDEAETIAEREIEALSDSTREELRLAVAQRVIRAMLTGAELLVRTQACLKSTDIYAIPPQAVAIMGATLLTSGMLNDATKLITDDDPAT
jgi:hypothetical protein